MNAQNLISSAIAGIIYIFITTLPISATTIDQMHFLNYEGYQPEWDSPWDHLLVFDKTRYYTMNDGTVWNSGAGMSRQLYAKPETAKVFGSYIQWELKEWEFANGILYEHADFRDDHYTEGILGIDSPFVLEAEIGSTIGTMTGYTRILSNEPTYVTSRTFHHYSADVGELVRYNIEYELLYGSVWTKNIFESDFSYIVRAEINFTQTKPIPEPSTLLLFGTGLTCLAGYRRRKAKRK